MNRIALFISLILHPLFIAGYGFLFLLFTNNYYSYFFTFKIKLILIAIAFSFTAVLPLINIFILKKLKLINDYFIDDNKQRTFPYILTALFHLGMAYLIDDFEIPLIFTVFTLSSALCIMITALINYFWKISAHMVGIGGILGMIMSVSILLKQNFIYPICFLLFLAGLIGFARLKLEAHKPSQVYAGFALGFLVCFLFILGWQVVVL